MAKEADDAALTWSGDNDPTHVSGKALPTVTASNSKSKDAAVGQIEKPDLHPLLLVFFGVIAGIYLLYAVGWGVDAFTHSVPVAGVFSAIMYQLGEFLAIASPLLWALAGWVLLKQIPTRLLWLLVGVILLAPWPFILPG
ncbi:MAG: hypothetical protein IT191_05305 [Microbacteriaceae bacterium]|nr:hypothetical protein [Microbacteriaceae bacterium]